jgi:4-amino-4-deoxy-L-arabinose transferase-like glycosyltransferase
MRGRGAAAVFLLALLVRAVVLLAFDGGTARPLEGDEQGYAAVAGSLARGDGFGFSISGTTTGGVYEERRLLAFRAPLLPLVLAPVHFAFEGSPEALRWACVLLGALAAPLAFGAAGRLGGSRAAWIAGVAVALWPSHAWLSARVLSEPLDSVLLLAGAVLLLRNRPVVGGAALGLAVLCRPGGLPAVLLATAAAASSEAKGRRFKPFLLSLLAIVAVVAPWCVRNQRLLGRPVLATTGGVTVFGGNCDAALEQEHPGKWVPPESAWRTAGEPDLRMYGWSFLGEVASSDRFADAAGDWILGNPGRAALLAFWKVVRFLDPDTHSDKPDSLLKSLAGWLSWGPALLLVLAALWAGRRLREPEWRVALALLVGHLLAAVVAYGDARMRAPVEPVLLAFLVAPLLATGVSKWTAARDAAKVRE